MNWRPRSAGDIVSFVTIRPYISVRADDPPIDGPEPPRESGWTFLPGWDWRHFLFFVGTPALIGLYAALNNWTVLQLAGYQGALLFYAGHSFVPWWTSCLTTYLCMRLLESWRPPQIILLIGSSLVACVLILPYSEWLTALFAAGWLKDDLNGISSSLHIHQEIGFWEFSIRATVVWVLVNLLFDRLLGLPRARYPVTAGSTPPAAAGERDGDQANDTMADSEAESQLRFLQRLPATIAPEAVIALKAEQHYIKVFTSDRNFMTLYRFSDAVAEMDPTIGQQVHRSYWVRTSAIQRMNRSSRKFSIELINGLKIPISAPNRGLMRQLAQQNDIPIFPPL